MEELKPHVPFDPNQPIDILEKNYDHSCLIRHQGITIEPLFTEIWAELDAHRYYPAYFIADDDTKRFMIAKALWTRLNQFRRVVESPDREPVGTKREGE